MDLKAIGNKAIRPLLKDSKEPNEATDSKEPKDIEETREPTQEQSKIILRQSRRVVILRSAIHTLPIIVSVILVAINASSIYAGPVSSTYQLLQFIAKVHELLLQASIAAIAVDHVRNELVGEGKVPFGAIFVALQTHKLSALWSKELRGTVTTNYFGGRSSFSFWQFHFTFS